MLMADIDAIIAIGGGEIVEVIGNAFVIRVGKGAFVLQDIPDLRGRASAGLQKKSRRALGGKPLRKESGRVDVFACTQHQNAFAAAVGGGIMGDLLGIDLQRTIYARASAAAVDDLRCFSALRCRRRRRVSNRGMRRKLPVALQKAVALNVRCVLSAKIGQTEPMLLERLRQMPLQCLM